MSERLLNKLKKLLVVWLQNFYPLPIFGRASPRLVTNLQTPTPPPPQ